VRARRAWLLALALPFLLAFGDKEDREPEDEGSATGTNLDKDVVYGEAGGEELRLDAITAGDPAGPRPGIILVHGGGWRRGGSVDMRVQARELARLGWATFSISYRLDEESGYPAEVEDVERAIAWVREHAADYDVDPDQLALAGSSSGGNLAALAAAAEHDVEGGRVAAVVSWSGIMDLPALAEQDDAEEGTTDKVADYLGCDLDDCEDTWEAASPITHVDAGDPPMFLANARDEDIPEAQATAMAEALDEAGVTNELHVVEGVGHGRGLSDLVWDDMVTFLSTQFEVPVPEPLPAPEPADRPGQPTSGEPAPDDEWPVVPAVVAGAVALGALGAWRLRRRRQPAEVVK
jgi:MYXO-CTERM domain-containing protein